MWDSEHRENKSFRTSIQVRRGSNYSIVIVIE